MAKHELLNNIKHKDIKVITRCAPEFGHQVGLTLTFPTEFGDVQREYPIFIRKAPETGEFQFVAVFGFENDENLFLEAEGWVASYIPAVIARGPFLIGFQTQTVDGQEVEEPVIHIDMDDPRISNLEGEPVFMPQGGNTPYLERVSLILAAINEGMKLSNIMLSAFEKYELIEPVSIDIDLKNGQKYKFDNYYTINEEKLKSLGPEALVELNSTGLLEGAYLLLASLNNMKKLIQMKNMRASAEA